MSSSVQAPRYILGQSDYAERRLELLNELSAANANFDQAVHILPHHNSTVLVLGCGSGHLEVRLSRLFTKSHFIGMDNSTRRIEESIARTAALNDSNTYEYIQADLTTFSIDALKQCDILVSRFVLSHLKDPIQQLERYLPLIRPGGYLWAEELASDGSEYYCNIANDGYNTFVKVVEKQIQVQQCSFEAGGRLLSELIHSHAKILFTYMSQPILFTASHKSILRLGIEDAKATVVSQLSESTMEEMISSLKQFEEDERSFGLYTRSLALVAQIY